MRYGNSQSESSGEKCPPGLYRATLVTVFDVGRQPGFTAADDPAHKVVLWWEIDKRDSKGRRFTIPQNVACWLSTKPSKFSKAIGALIGRPLTEAECKEGVDDTLFVGKSAMVYVAPPGEGSKWPKIDSVMPLGDGAWMPPESKDSEANVPKLVKDQRAKAVGGWKPPTPTPANKSAPAGAQWGALPSREPGDESEQPRKGDDLPF
jgi:hypothetical protein